MRVCKCIATPLHRRRKTPPAPPCTACSCPDWAGTGRPDRHRSREGCQPWKTREFDVYQNISIYNQRLNNVWYVVFYNLCMITWSGYDQLVSRLRQRHDHGPRALAVQAEIFVELFGALAVRTRTPGHHVASLLGLDTWGKKLIFVIS